MPTKYKVRTKQHNKQKNTAESVKQNKLKLAKRHGKTATQTPSCQAAASQHLQFRVPICRLHHIAAPLTAPEGTHLTNDASRHTRFDRGDATWATILGNEKCQDGNAQCHVATGRIFLRNRTWSRSSFADVTPLHAAKTTKQAQSRPRGSFPIVASK